ncbi:unnamed protein product [Bursaphelenchus xylophilus]|uniref:(pine wood nematode) hypothetical protein n=1 Tax=Bursaphelenchus xylophilus TaxID=6326 RepID=A0A1I7SLV5_BURXY|nr:unnamed protein product [Bursaphelenchus xylophilus]CAG9129866.1 unnamed protein product [Bursaphelenchus xylophilus]
MRKKKKDLERIHPSDSVDVLERQRELQKKRDEKAFWTPQQTSPVAPSIPTEASSAKKTEEELLGIGPIPRDVAREIDEEQARRKEIEPEVRF